MFEALIGMLMAFIFVFLIIFLVMYILQGIGLMTITKRMEMKNGWMAWVPILNFALIGKIAFNNILVQITLPLLLILGGSYESAINGETVSKGTILPSPLDDIANFIFVVLLFVCLYRIYKKLSNKAVVMLIFSILSFGLLSPIFLFAIRNNPILEGNAPVDNNPPVSNTTPVNSIPPVNNVPLMNNTPPMPNQNIPSDNQPTQNNQQ